MKYIGFGSLNARRAWPPARSESWSPTLTRMVKPSSSSIRARSPLLYSIVECASAGLVVSV